LHGTHPETNLPTDVRIERSLYPSNPGSVYHMTKVMDHTMFQFYAKNWGVPITDLHQGIVYGVETDETLAHPILTNRFDYDSAYGTVLNRFLVQAAMGHPLTVYGNGGQTRAFIHIRDTVKCVRLAVESTVEQTNVVRTMNQVAETHNVLQLANLVSGLFDAKISNIENPRNELAENSLFVSNASFRSLGFKPTTLADSLLQEVNTYIKPNLGRVNPAAILPSEFWR
jgi:UDP-sulfoquinovose synthase